MTDLRCLSDSSLERRLFTACSCASSGVPTFTISISTIVVVAVVIGWLSVSVAISGGLLLGFRLRLLLLLSIRVSLSLCLCLWLWLSIGCHRLLGFGCDDWLSLSCISLRLSHGLVHISVVVLECTFEQEISGKFFVFVACKVCLSSSLLGEAKRLEAFNGLELLRGHLHDIAWGAGLARLTGTSSRHSCTHATAWHTSSASISTRGKSKIWVAGEYSIHESTLVALDGIEKLWVLLLGPVNEVLVEAWILSHSLCHHSKILVVKECSKIGVDLALATTWSASHVASNHATHGRILSITIVLVTIVSEALTTARSTQATWVLSCQSLQLLHIDSLKEDTTSKICVVFGHSKGLDAQISWLVRDCNQSAHSFFINTRG